jgi:hypothetical protein
MKDPVRISAGIDHDTLSAVGTEGEIAPGLERAHR